MRTQLHDLPPRSSLETPTVGVRSVRSLSQREWESANRLGLLLIHALVGLFAGMLILFNGTASTFDSLAPWPRVVTGALALLGGGLLASGLSARPRRMHLEIAGLTFLATWDLTMAVGFVAGALRDHQLVATWPWQAIPHADPTRLYPIVLYAGLFLMMCVHLATIRGLSAVKARRG